MSTPDWIIAVGKWFGSITASDWIQLAIGVIAIGASVVALVIANKDRKTQMKIAQMDRQHSRLLLELEYIVRLSANRNRGGSTDGLERKQMAAEALALAGVVGERWVPEQWKDATGGQTLEEMRAIIEADPTDDHPLWVHKKIETFLGMQALLSELHAEQEK